MLAIYTGQSAIPGVETVSDSALASLPCFFFFFHLILLLFAVQVQVLLVLPVAIIVATLRLLFLYRIWYVFMFFFLTFFFAKPSFLCVVCEYDMTLIISAICY